MDACIVNSLVSIGMGIVYFAFAFLGGRWGCVVLGLLVKEGSQAAAAAAAAAAAVRASEHKLLLTHPRRAVLRDGC
eukprot:1161763-Pelagomonas_calceolata.AAC.1